MNPLLLINQTMNSTTTQQYLILLNEIMTPIGSVVAPTVVCNSKLVVCLSFMFSYVGCWFAGRFDSVCSSIVE